MKIAVIGKGNVGGGLARLWRVAGHEVQELGREGGDVSDADAVLVAQGERPDFRSLAHQVKSINRCARRGLTGGRRPAVLPLLEPGPGRLRLPTAR